MTQKQKENIKHERVLKLKKIGFWTLNIVSYILAGLFLIVLIISLATPKKQNISPRSAYNLYQEQITEVINDTPNNVIYDDENHEAILNVDELNNYTWNNLLNYFNRTDINVGNFENGYDYITFYSPLNEYNFSSLTQIHKEYNETYFQYYYDNSDESYSIFFNTDDNNKFLLFDQNDGDYISFTYNIIITFTDSVNDDNNTNQINTAFEYLKSAIELDIQANESSETQTIFESLTNVLSNFITTLNSGITSVLNLFWDSTNLQLTLLGNLTTIVIGVAVCFFLFRLVIGLIRLRG